ncbi:Prolyl-tRNA editing protein ProX [Vibrio thalassae]|uniref:Prolyl-tRNA editing protein ProX n=1 Tax=Vibrio thalassae TaxID=1243014 RepID=A0A240EA10_9VIBR|nr:YbaK/EbsC family protein [Vibrio thalassae]SNX45361.1 Prolyl-tRNA editing protein ProX [Vibrio thalassae]
MDNTQQIYLTNVALLEEHAISFNQWQHEPILDFATDERIAKELGWTGVHSKSLFLKKKGGGFVLFLSDKDTRLDKTALKQAVGKRTSICSNEEMIEQIGCVQGAVCPIGLPEEITIVVDKALLLAQEVLYTPGLPEWTFGLSGADLQRVLSWLPNHIVEIDIKKGEA